MELYLLKHPGGWDYDDFDSAVVCAESPEDARMIHPKGWFRDEVVEWDGLSKPYDGWVDAKDVVVVHVGTANDGVERGVVCASFNAG